MKKCELRFLNLLPKSELSSGEKIMKKDSFSMINRKEKDETAKEEQERKLNEFQDWLMSGIIDPQRAKEIIELYYKEMPF